MTTFQVGDVVRRLPEFRDPVTYNWHFGDKLVVVEGLDRDFDIWIEGSPISWDSRRFELVARPTTINGATCMGLASINGVTFNLTVTLSGTYTKEQLLTIVEKMNISA